MKTLPMALIALSTSVFQVAELTAAAAPLILRGHLPAVRTHGVRHIDTIKRAKLNMLSPEQKNLSHTASLKLARPSQQESEKQREARILAETILRLSALAIKGSKQSPRVISSQQENTTRIANEKPDAALYRMIFEAANRDQ